MSHTVIFGKDSSGFQHPVRCNTNGELELAGGLTVSLDAQNDSVQVYGDYIGTKTALTTTASGALNVWSNPLSSSTDEVVVYGNDGSSNQKLKTSVAGRLEVDVNSSVGTLSTSDTTTQSKLDTLHTDLIGTLNVSDSLAQSSLNTIVSQTALNATNAEQQSQTSYLISSDGKLSTLITNTTGLNNCIAGNELQVDIVSAPTLTVSQNALSATTDEVVVYGNDGTANHKLLTDATGKLTVNLHDQEKTTTSATLQSATSIPASGSMTTSAVDMDGHRVISVYGNTTNTMDSIYIQMSDDNVNWYKDSQAFIYPDFNSGDFSYTLKDVAVRYVRFVKDNTQGGAETITLKYTQMKF